MVSTHISGHPNKIRITPNLRNNNNPLPPQTFYQRVLHIEAECEYQLLEPCPDSEFGVGVSVLVLKRGVDEYNLQAVAVTIGDQVFPFVTDDIDAVDMCIYIL